MSFSFPRIGESHESVTKEIRAKSCPSCIRDEIYSFYARHYPPQLGSGVLDTSYPRFNLTMDRGDEI